MGALGAKASDLSVKGEKTGGIHAACLMRWVEGCWRRQFRAYCAWAENALRQRNTRSDIRVDVQEMRVWKDMWQGGGHLQSLLPTYFHGQNTPETLRVQPIHVVHRGLMYCRRGDTESLPSGETKGSLMGKLTSGQNIPDSGEWGQSLWSWVPLDWKSREAALHFFTLKTRNNFF